MEILPFVDILKVFNNPISEEQAWAVCYQCAHFLYRNPTQGFYQDVCDSGINSIWISRHGDVLLRKGKGLQEPNGSGKGPPHSPQKQNSLERRHSNTSIVSCRSRSGGVIATEIDAVQGLGMAIFEALDYGIDATEERQLSAGLESLIATMTQAVGGGGEEEGGEYNDAASQNADDEGIEKDAADDELEHRCTVEDVLKMCRQHLSSKQDSNHHFKAVCRALATEAGELFTFLDKISSGRQRLTETPDEDANRLEELQRADWACLWVQVMRSLRQGVLLKKIEHVHQPPLEYELTPFEMILEDIRTRRYTLHKITVNGEIPHQVKNDAHEVILNFIRSRPPLKRVDERKLKPKPPAAPDPHEKLLQDIRAKPKLRPVREGKLVVETSGARAPNQRDEPEVSVPVKRIIKADLNLLLDNSSDESSEEDTLDMSTPSLSSSTASTPSPQKSPHGSDPIAWRRAAAMTQDLSANQQRPSKLQRRHTIMVCEAPMEGKVAQELPPLAEEEDEPSPIKESHSLASLHSRLRPNPSYTQQQQQQHQFHFPLQQLPQQQFYHHPSFQKTSFSDHDIQNPSQVTLRHPQGGGGGLKRRSSMEHRRSLTSLPTGLCAIPEMEDSGGSGTDGSPGTQRPSPLARRSWSSEQAPPPNPSPPIKARVRAGVGTGMNSSSSSSMLGTGSRLSRSASLPSSTLQSQLSSNSTKGRQTKHTSSSHSSYSSSSSSYPMAKLSNSNDSMQSNTNKRLVSAALNETQSTASKLSSSSIASTSFSSSHVPPPPSTLALSTTSSTTCSSSSMPTKLDDNNDNKHASSSSSSSPSHFTSPRNSKNPLSPSSSRAKHLSTASIFLAAAPKSSPSPGATLPSPSPPTTPTSSRLSKGVKLDSSVSSQSPAYNKQHPTPAPRTMLQQGHRHVVIEPTPHRQATSPSSPTQQSRWRQPNALEERRARRQQGGVVNDQQLSSPLSPRKSSSSPLLSTSSSFPTHHHQSHQDNNIPEDPSSPSASLPSRRLSLDGGVSRYSTENGSSSARWREGLQASKTNKPSSEGRSIDKESAATGVHPVPNRRMSLGERGHRLTEKAESQDEIEKISRWRALQDEDMENRVGRNGAKTRTTIVPVMRSPSSGAFDIRGRVPGTRNSMDSDEGSKSFSSRYQQLKQQYQSEQQRNLHDTNDIEHNGHAESGDSAMTQKTNNRVTSDYSQQQQPPPQQQQPQQIPQQQQQHHKSRISASGRRLLYESPEALQHHMATEEARLARWRQLEEGSGAAVMDGGRGGGAAPKHVGGDDYYYDDSSIPSDYNDLSESDLEYVSDSGSGRGHASPDFNRAANRYYSNHPVGLHADNTTITTTTTIPVDDGNDTATTTTTTTQPNVPSDSSTVSSSSSSSHYVMPKRWENPVECLSLTLEEVTHIRSVLTMAELESLISHPDLYQMVSKSKLCFTCKTTRFSLFGEWGTKCKFCKRTVCSKCLRKMTVPSDHFRNIPVYSLSPTPLSQEVLEFIQNFVRKVPNVSSFPGPSNTKKHPIPSSVALRQSLPPATSSSTSTLSLSSSRQKDNSSMDNTDKSTNPDRRVSGSQHPSPHPAPINPAKPLIRSQSVLVPGHKTQNTLQTAGTGLAAKNTSLTRSASVHKGQLMAICCDCKGMIMEIIRASKTSLALISAPGTTDNTSSTPSLTSVNVLPTLTELSSSSEHQQNSQNVSFS